MVSKIKKDPTVTKQQRMVIDIIHTANWLDERISKVLKGFGITHPQFNILKNIQAAHPEPLSVKEIKDTIMFTNSDVTRLVDRLVKKELLCRDTCPENRRKMDVSITEKGVDMLDQILPELKKTFNNFFETKVSLEDALKTSEILRRIRQ
ncbi:MAG TPA: MarR family transcriptional regulator [Bacteroidales bacterium]|jgi:DNA-binding MarR family transcriptional regulator|nr:hypothetical protein [Bacteroidota bacterium]HJN06183.1 MarR family transcriptional regulator [Bacteroidales bacterium]|tara:strand:- start:302 stop:751 length:450 start_codon:yes stop_codon:yes gene_type:complete